MKRKIFRYLFLAAVLLPAVLTPVTLSSKPRVETELVTQREKMGRVCVPFFLPSFYCYKEAPWPVGDRCFCHFGGQRYLGYILG